MNARDEAIANLRAAIRRLDRLWANHQTEPIADDLSEALADLQQAVRYLTGEERPN